MDKVNPRLRQGAGHARAFSIVELLAVMVILILLASITLPAVNSMMGATNLSRSGEALSDNLARARQEAVSRSREVEVQFYNIQSSSQGWRAMQMFRVEQTAAGRTLIPLSRVIPLNDGVMISSNASLSPLLTADSAIQGSTNIPGYGPATYAGFRYRPNGTVSGTVTGTNNFLTLQNTRATGNPPANYYTVQVNPMTGKVIVFRP